MQASELFLATWRECGTQVCDKIRADSRRKATAFDRPDLLVELFGGLVHGLDEEVDVVLGELVSKPFDGFEQFGMARFKIGAERGHLGFKVFAVLLGFVAGIIAHSGHRRGQ